MKEINGNLCLFTSRFIKPGEEILYDYGVKNLPWEKKTCKTQVGIERKGDPGLFINFEEKEIKDRRISTEDKQSENYGLEALEAAYKTQHTPCDLNISSRDKNTTTNEDKDGHTEKGQNDKMGPDLKIQGLDVNMATASCTAMDVEISNVYEDQQLNVQGLEINPGKAIDTMNSNEVFAHADINNKEKIKNDNEDQDLEVQVDKVSNTAMNIEIDNVDNRTGDTEKDLKHWNRKKYIISNEVLTHTDINNNKEKRKNDYEDQDLEVLRGEVIVVAMDIENNDADNKTGGTENDLEDWNRENNMTSNEVITHADINSDTEEQQYDEGQVLVIQGPEIDEVNANDIAVDIEINNFGNSTGNTYNDSEPSYREIDSATNEVYTDESEDIYTAQLLNAKEEQVFKIQGPEMDAGKVKDTLIDIAIVDIGNRISDSKSVSGFDIDHECDLFNSKEKVELTNSDFENMSCTDIQEKHFIEMDKEADIEIQRWIRCRESKRQDQRVEIIDEEVINQNAEGQYYQRDVTGLEDHKNVTDIEVHVIKNIDGPELHNVKEGSDSFSEQANIGSISNKISLLQNTGKWGAVAIVKGGEEIGVYPMETDLLSIGSAETDDIRVKTAVKHEALIEVNQQGEIFLVNSSTQKVERLSDNTIFEVGGRALKWKAKTGTCQQDEKVELVVLRENNAFKLAGYGEQQQSNMITDSKMHGFVPNSDSEAESDVVPYPKLSSIVVTNADSTTSSMSEEKQRKKVISVRNKEDRAGKVDYSKRHACIFCGQLDLKIARHLCSKKHENEELIARLPPVSKPGSELQKRREKTLNALRNEGDFIYNIDILKSGSKNQSGIIVAKRPSEGSHNAEDYLPCRYCLRFYVQTELWRHSVNCSFRQDPIVNESNKSDEKESSRFIKSGRMLLHGAGVHLHSGETSWEDDEFYTYVLGALQNDTIGRSLKRDSGLILYGKTEFERLGRRRANEVRYRMRLLERIKTVVKSLHESDSSFDMESLLTPDRFPSFIQAVRTVVGISEERSLNGVMMFDKPELARKVGQMIRKFAEMCEGRSVVNGNREARQSVTDFLFLYTSQWKSKIGSIAHQTSAEKKFNRKTALPLTEDLKKMQQHLDKEIVERGNKLQKFPCSQTWKEFAKVLLTKLTLFNFRRGNECAAMQVAKFQQRNDWKLDNQEIYQSLQRFEQELAQRMDLVEVMGKRNRKVPVLLTQPMKAGIERLIQFRDICGVHPENIYVFAKGQKSFIEGSDALRCVLEQVQDLKRPELLRFPSMRKYLATVIQVHNYSFRYYSRNICKSIRHEG
ncbi:uncharacterized protein LOC132742612 isoform X2 [Ruditapes philippinarum]|nr:uncharacterized protein LOC132742612 isoform X2 [Ruditapes philippinarum]XP_060587045.1 uncharacterized protein LOC132742612 isoform X2 [Ruditapes philippinarum]